MYLQNSKAKKRLNVKDVDMADHLSELNITAIAAVKQSYSS
jgi:hypothetical protein